MQAIKGKLNDMSHMRKAKAEAKEEEKQEKEMAKTRVQVAKEVRMAREAEAAMDLHVNKAAEKIAHQETKCIQNLNADQLTGDPHQNPYGHGVCDGDYSTRSTYGDQNIMQDSYDHDTGNLCSNANLETSYPTNRTRVPPNTNKLL
ncbi:hypothetical protein ACH5RR_000538 [Cinchona calisaya]|uniref:Late embryogenesis abundant protein n=1 Tax=Cinchona calisaya TaxID=153742 RepID=A0ABD3B0W4_9GENT